jgi:hypothetical protein
VLPVDQENADARVFLLQDRSDLFGIGADSEFEEGGAQRDRLRQQPYLFFLAFLLLLPEQVHGERAGQKQGNEDKYTEGDD